MTEDEFWVRGERVDVLWPDSVVADLATIGVSPVLTVARFDDALRAEIDAAERALWDALFPRSAAAGRVGCPECQA